MKQQIDLMTGHNFSALDQLPSSARHEGHTIAAGVLAVAAFCVGSTISPGLVAPKTDSVTVMEIEVAADIPKPRSSTNTRLQRSQALGNRNIR